MGRPLVRGVDERAVLRVREHFGLSAGELLVDVDRRRERGTGRAGGAPAREVAGEHCGHRQNDDPHPRSATAQTRLQSH